MSDLDWHLKVIGDGPLREEILALFAEHPSFADHLGWRNARRIRLPMNCAHADLYCWPGCGEAYGLAYLEAQAAGIPVVAQEIAGVPEVVRNGETGMLTAGRRYRRLCRCDQAFGGGSPKAPYSLVTAGATLRIRRAHAGDCRATPRCLTERICSSPCKLTGRFSLRNSAFGLRLVSHRVYGFAMMMPLLRQRLWIVCFRCAIATRCRSSLAVIPEPTGEELARHLRDTDLVSVAVHGWRHANHASANEKKQELGKQRPAYARSSRNWHADYPSSQHFMAIDCCPCLVPPWNRIDANLVSAVSGAGFRAISAFADKLIELQTTDLAVINTHLDIMDWSTRRGGDHGELALRSSWTHSESREKLAAILSESSPITSCMTTLHGISSISCLK